MNGRTNSSGTIINDLEIPLDPVTNFVAKPGNGQVSLTWTDPKDKYATPEGEAMEDTDQLVSVWAYTRIVRKIGSAPASPNDGVLVVESSVRNQYQNTAYMDSGLTNDTTYYYGVFAINEDGVESEGAFENVMPKARPVTYGVFGVQWDTSNSSTALSRLTIEGDPNHLVDHNISDDPVPAVGTGVGSSPFDNFSPWMNMKEYNIVNGEPLYKQGDEGFSRTQYDTMVWVPEFWYMIEQSDNIIRYYVASDEQPGFEKHPGSGRYMARYTAATSSLSVSGRAPRVDLTRATARAATQSKGTGWQLDDYAAWCARNLLYLVEFADFNSQAKIGLGNIRARAALNNGGTDSMIYHTGWAAGTDGYTAVQYRHMENVWGNLKTWVDGVNFYSTQVWASTDPSSYGDATQEGYSNLGSRISMSAYISKLSVPSGAPWAMFPTAWNGSSSTYVSDGSEYGIGSEWRQLAVGGDWSGGSEAGLWYFDGSCDQDFAHIRIGFRTLWVP